MPGGGDELLGDGNAVVQGTQEAGIGAVDGEAVKDVDVSGSLQFIPFSHIGVHSGVGEECAVLSSALPSSFAVSSAMAYHIIHCHNMIPSAALMLELMHDFSPFLSPLPASGRL